MVCRCCVKFVIISGGVGFMYDDVMVCVVVFVLCCEVVCLFEMEVCICLFFESCGLVFLEVLCMVEVFVGSWLFVSEDVCFLVLICDGVYMLLGVL